MDAKTTTAAVVADVRRIGAGLGPNRAVTGDRTHARRLLSIQVMDEQASVVGEVPGVTGSSSLPTGR